MFTNYFKIALRYVLKNRVFSLINIAGLSLSLACAMLMILYTKDELTFDRFHKEGESLYLITIDVRFPDGSSMDKMGMTGFLQGPRFRASIPEIETFSRSTTSYRNVQLGDNVQSQLVMLADTNFFSLFTFPLLSGNPHQALVNPNSVVLSEDAAIKYFGTTDALNKTILVEKDAMYEPGEAGFKSYVVTGVAKRCPQNSSIQFDMLFPADIKPEMESNPEGWAGIAVNTFVKLRKGADPLGVAEKMRGVYDRESKEVMDRIHATGFNETFFHELRPLADVHLHPDVNAPVGITNGSQPIYSYILSGIAVFVLVIACINFINLTIARSVRRSKEIGIRKVIGGARKQLIMQFLGESFLISSLSFIAAIFLSQMLLPWFNGIVNKQLALAYLLDTKLITVYIVLFLITGLLAGFYPAVVLSGYSPVATLYNQFKIAGSNFLQKTLIVFQFTLATFMIVATFGIATQFDYLTHKDLGYRSDHIVEVPSRGFTGANAKVFGEELLRDHNILMVTPYGPWREAAKINGDSIYNFPAMTIGKDFIELLDLKIVEGRNFSDAFPGDSAHSVLVNESFAKLTGWSSSLGKEIHTLPLKGDKRTIVGVVKDYHYNSLSKEIEPQMFSLAPCSQNLLYSRMLIRIKPNSETASLAHIERTFRKMFPMLPYSYEFTDEVNRKNYTAESKWKGVIFAAAGLTIFIACIGLLGLSMLTTERRFKEIGIRKVMGASVKSIVLTLSKDFVFLIALALLIAMPFAWYVVNLWLERYPYRTEITPLLYASAGLLVLVVAILTTGYHSVKAGRMNPVEVIRRE